MQKNVNTDEILVNWDIETCLSAQLFLFHQNDLP